MPVNTEFEIEIPENEIILPVNSILLEWVIENLVRNGVDSIKGKGEIKIAIIDKPTNVMINITDNGDGINRSMIKTIFKPALQQKSVVGD